jgi:hypothetical protein
MPETEPQPVAKPGYKTTEGWLTALTSLLSLLYAFGLIGNGQGVDDKVAAFLCAALATAGYSVSRGMVKKPAPPPA